jgi:hypothetical protein
MVDTNSPVFNFAEKVGTFVGKGIRYMVIGSVIVFLGGKFGGSTTPAQPGPTGVPQPSPNNPPQP